MWDVECLHIVPDRWLDPVEGLDDPFCVPMDRK
jgi:hypothetical protein